ncbi:MAG TPA: response regulator [Anaerolineae bacterium]|nr:response regulator [Anaerolineae bacterium]HRV90782.1 response regulator [Anaerolineae bacterium]
MSQPNILVVDNDEGFGFMLKDGLNNTGQFAAEWVDSGSDAIQAVVEDKFDLVIIDVGLPDMKPEQLVQAIRHTKNTTKIMLIPMIGQNLPEYLQDLEINGVLPKPFFVGDLPDLVNQALGRKAPQVAPVSVPQPVAAEAPAALSDNKAPPPVPSTPALDNYAPNLNIPVVPQETVRYLRASETEILRILSDLNREVRAEAILLIAGVNLIAQAGMLNRTQCEDLAVLVAQSSQAAAQAARFLGERAGRFTQSIHEGGAYRLYTLTLSEGVLLSLALSTNVPLGMIRHQCRQISEKLSKFII